MASRYLCHERPDLLASETLVVDACPGAVVLARSAFDPGGRGQLPDRGLVRWTGGEVRVDVYQEFAGALVTGVQMGGDGTARIDVDLPPGDSNKLRALEPAINDAIRQELVGRHVYAGPAEAEREPGLIRSQAVAPPPQPDGSLRGGEIVGLDRQACGGTHVSSTGQSPPVRILKVDNEGRHNRRIRIGLAGT